jgi:hypothetical protein
LAANRHEAAVLAALVVEAAQRDPVHEPMAAAARTIAVKLRQSDFPSLDPAAA